MNREKIYTIDPIFDFQILCDIDLGLYRLIKEDYYDRSVFDNNLFDSDDEVFIKTVLLSRELFNPLNVFCKEGALTDEERNNIYKEFLDTEYDRILELSTPTTIMEIASRCNNTNSIVNVTVLCNSEKEEEWIHKYNRKLKCIVSNYSDLDLDKYDTLYIKDIYTLLAFNQESIKNKNIIFPIYAFNLEDKFGKTEVPIKEIAEKYYMDNKFISIQPYRDIVIPVSEWEDGKI